MLGGDILLNIEGIAVSAPNMAKIRDHMNGLKSGAPFKATILRSGKIIELSSQVP